MKCPLHLGYNPNRAATIMQADRPPTVRLAGQFFSLSSPCSTGRPANHRACFQLCAPHAFFSILPAVRRQESCGRARFHLFSLYSSLGLGEPPHGLRSYRAVGEDLLPGRRLEAGRSRKAANRYKEPSRSLSLSSSALSVEVAGSFIRLTPSSHRRRSFPFLLTDIPSYYTILDRQAVRTPEYSEKQETGNRRRRSRRLGTSLVGVAIAISKKVGEMAESCSSKKSSGPGPIQAGLDYIAKNHLWVLALLVVPISLAYDLLWFIRLRVSFDLLGGAFGGDKRKEHLGRVADVQRQVRQWGQEGRQKKVSKQGKNDEGRRARVQETVLLLLLRSFVTWPGKFLVMHYETKAFRSTSYDS